MNFSESDIPGTLRPIRPAYETCLPRSDPTRLFSRGTMHSVYVSDKQTDF